jgi:hypothetical protein
MVRAGHGHGMASVNQTRPRCVNQMGKTHSKPFAAQHGRGTAWARHAMCESALIVSSPGFQVTFVHSIYNLALFLPSCCCSCLLHVATNSILIFLASRQNFFLSFAGKKSVFGYSSEKFHLD